VENAKVGHIVDILSNQTPFYGESGGQIGDTGKLTTLKGFVGEVEDTFKPLGKLHVLRTKVVAGELTVGETIHQKVDAERRNRVRANHSATHLLHAALRRHLGTHVTQKGSLVAPDYFRFDFSHPKALAREEIDAVEAEVNAQIRSNEPVTTRLMTPDEAISAGAMALFGEKYGDEVRVVEIGEYSKELCGGTHVRSTAEIGPFVILSEKAVGSGARRIEAVTSGEAWSVLEGRSRELDAVREELEQTRRDAKKPKAAAPGPDIVWQDRQGGVLVAEVSGARGSALRDFSDQLRQREDAAAVVLASADEGKVALVVNLDNSLAEVDAVKIVRELGPLIGGGGGGRPTLAEAGGKNVEGVRGALEAGRDKLAAAIG